MAKRTAKPKPTATATEEERVITTAELLDRIPLDRSTIWRMAKDGRFPAPIQLTSSRIGWRWSSVEKWLRERERHRIPQRPYFGRELDAATD
jgi:prophage regulatory protein